jgi:predicted dehydrogenase
VIGLGVGEQHARAFAAHPSCQVKWLHDLDDDRAARLAAALGQGSPAKDLAAVLADPAVDIVSIATYDDQHADQVLAALAAGKHVFCEKPLCRTLDEARAIARARAKGGRHLACNLVLRSAPLYVWLRDAVRAGELGDVYAYDGDYLYGRVSKITDGWRGEVERYSVFQGGAVHLVDLMMWLLGERPTRVSAVGNQIATRGTRFRYRDFVAATFELPSGIVGRVSANFGCVHRHQHVVRVFGTRATFIHDDAGPRLHRVRDPGEPPHRLTDASEPRSKGDLIAPFVRAILAGDSPAPAASHELDVIAACIAADHAADTAQPQAIEYP